MPDEDPGFSPVGFGDSPSEPVVESQPQSEPVGDQPNPASEELFNLFLKDVAPQDRDIVARYAKQWNAGATKKFQEYSARIKPYEALGPVEDVQKAWQLAQVMRAQPEVVFRHMWNAMSDHYGDDFEGHLMKILEIEEEMSNAEGQLDQGSWDQNGGEPPDPNQVWQSNVSEQLQSMQERIDAYEREKQEAAENEQLDKLLGEAHNAFGDFDDEWVLLQVSKHGNMAKAVKDWQAKVGGNSQGPQRQAPKVLGSQGGVPSGQVDTAKLRGNDRKAHVMAMLAGLDSN